MIDLEKEKEEFKKVYTEIYGEHDQLWQGWKKRAELAQDEINNEREQATEYYIDCEYLKSEITELKQKIEKLESGEFVLVPKDEIEAFWQDNDEPKNFCSLESNLECLGDGIDLNEIMTINKHHTAHIETEKMYGTWFAKFGHPKEKANFHVGNHQECLDIVAKNKAMIESVEKDHE